MSWKNCNACTASGSPAGRRCRSRDGMWSQSRAPATWLSRFGPAIAACGAAALLAAVLDDLEVGRHELEGLAHLPSDHVSLTAAAGAGALRRVDGMTSASRGRSSGSLRRPSHRPYQPIGDAPTGLRMASARTSATPGTHRRPERVAVVTSTRRPVPRGHAGSCARGLLCRTPMRVTRQLSGAGPQRLAGWRRRFGVGAFDLRHPPPLTTPGPDPPRRSIDRGAPR